MSFQYEPTVHAKRPKRAMHPNSLTTYWDQVLPTLSPRERAVLEIIDAHAGGLTMKEVAVIMHVPWHTISGRPKKMREKGAIRETGANRDECAVYVSCRPGVPTQQSLWGAA